MNTPILDTGPEEIRKIIESAISELNAGGLANRVETLQQLSQAIKSLSEAERAQVEKIKFITEERKTKYDLDNIARSERLERRQKYVSILTPLATTFVLVLTLMFQTYQFNQTERDKELTAEDAQWAEAVKTVSQSAMLSPITVSLNPFLKSPRYADQAQKLATQVLMTGEKGNDPLVFEELFRDLFVPVSWANLDRVLELNRSLAPKLAVLYAKAWDSSRGANDKTRLSTAEAQQYDYIEKGLAVICAEMRPLLTGPRPKGQTLDVRSGWFNNCDWRNVDLSGANIENINFQYSDVTGADLSDITSFGNAYLPGTAWWTAKKISSQLLEYLTQNFPFNQQMRYGPGFLQLKRSDYEEALQRLSRAA